MVKALPATPAMPQPRPNVKRSTRSVSIPTALGHRSVGHHRAHLLAPAHAENQQIDTNTVINAVSTMTIMPLIGIWIVSVRLVAPIIQSG